MVSVETAPSGTGTIQANIAGKDLENLSSTCLRVSLTSLSKPTTFLKLGETGDLPSTITPMPWWWGTTWSASSYPDGTTYRSAREPQLEPIP